jgi:hypothetical protein
MEQESGQLRGPPNIKLKLGAKECEGGCRPASGLDSRPVSILRQLYCLGGEVLTRYIVSVSQAQEATAHVTIFGASKLSAALSK